MIFITTRVDQARNSCRLPGRDGTWVCSAGLVRSQADRARGAVRVRGLADLDGGDGLVQARDGREAVETQHLAHAREALDGGEHDRRAARRDLREVAHLAQATGRSSTLIPMSRA